MTFDVRAFGRDYRRFLRLILVVSHLHLPTAMAYKFAGLVGERLGPLRWQKGSYRDGIEAGGYLTEAWPRLWRRKVQDHGAFCVNAFAHQHWDQTWFQAHVTMDATGLQRIMAEGRGCLFLTYHHAFHHTLFCLLGLAGFTVNVLAAPEESSVIFEEVGHFIRRLHQGCIRQFNGGKYLFISSARHAVRMTEEALAAGTVLCSLNDVPSGPQPVEKDFPRLAGRLLPVPSGSIRLAQRLGVPIVVGGVLRDGVSYRLVYRQLDATLPYPLVLQAYFDYLSEILKGCPEFWDGWDSFPCLGKAPATEGSIHA